MAAPSVELVRALRTTAERLKSGAQYQWGHFGACNCGHLAQTITKLSKAQIHRAAWLYAKDWADAAVEYCPTSGYPIDHVLTEMLALGLTTNDIAELERLSSLEVLARLMPERSELSRNVRDDVVLYMETWAQLLEEQLPTQADDSSRHAA